MIKKEVKNLYLRVNAATESDEQNVNEFMEEAGLDCESFNSALHINADEEAESLLEYEAESQGLNAGEIKNFISLHKEALTQYMLDDDTFIPDSDTMTGILSEYIKSIDEIVAAEEDVV